MTVSLPLFAGLAAFVVAIVASYVAILALRPLLRRYALARPNARSSHREPTPQGGGIAVVGVAVALMVLTPLVLDSLTGETVRQLDAVIGATLLLAIAGTVDDIRGLGALPRLALHVVAVAIMLMALPAQLRLVPALPFAVERALLLLATVWFINLVNFMDGIDWITAAEVVPVCAGLVIAGICGALPPLGLLTATVLAGAMLGFVPFNRPIATLFLGDVGSVPIGLIVAWLLIVLAGSGHFAAALLLPLYYLADATITLARRLVRGEKIWEAHRSHFYQRATVNGLTVRGIVGRVFAVNVCLVALATMTILWRSTATDIAGLVLGAVLVGSLLYRFARPAKPVSATPS